ncbi:response regulator transcription factor [Alkalihalobacillus hemicellulosilyticus]|uniref:Signal transduction response regulator n=1 Tax=Halalkalibacter hemicellulosilyticusJCM 9152 TaxID=1236971 RepID=W4QJ90_9BACI|nr:AraC family transcriptional regulator [Halalkalibacter hemicellulosilyticus]GAE32161.1 signal transduction response regulator [Halalkalibacter hemicellulosilyticusJCM 9152]
MKVLLVDDNFQMLEFMYEMISWRELGLEVIGKCETGIDALEIAQDKTPDILITDIDMPNMNGLELIAQMKSLNEHVQALIISCHDDFHYAQKAVRLYVNDYILKETLEPKTFRVAVNKLVSEARKQKQEQAKVASLKTIVDQNKKNLKKQWLQNFLTSSNLNEREWKHTNEYFQLNLDDYHYIPISGRMMNIEAGWEKFRSSEELFSFFVEKVAKETLGQGIELEGALYEPDQLIWCFPYVPTMKENPYEEVRKRLKQFQTILKKCSGVCITFAYKQAVTSVLELKQSLKQLTSSEAKWFYVEEQEIVRFEDIKESTNDQTIFQYYNEALEEWKKVTLEGDQVKASQIVDRWMSIIKKEHYHPDSVRSWLHNLIITIELHYYYTFENERHHGSRHSSIQEIANVCQLKKYMNDFFQRIIHFVQSSSRTERLEVWEAKKYVEQNLHERITMEAVANNLYMNPSHFSRLFKKETGETFIEYVIRVKMEKAAAYLRETNKAIEDIAHMLGYENTSYFIKLFKKRNDISPLEYRKAN